MRPTSPARSTPTHWDEGPGRRIQLQRKGYTDDDWKHGKGGLVDLWIMDPGYPPVGDKYAGLGGNGPQVSPAREIGVWLGRRVFLWGSAPEWQTMETDILAALKATDANATPNAAPPVAQAGAAKPGTVAATSLADQVADRFVAHLASLEVSFLTKARLAELRKEVREFAARYEPAGMAAADREKLLAGVDRYLARQFRKYDYVSAAWLDESTYLWLPDKLRTFEWMLWVSLTRKPLSPEQIAVREGQRKWLQQFLVTVPIRPGDGVPVRGMRPEQVRPWAIEQVDQDYSDPFSLLYDPLAKKQFENFQRILGYSAANGLRSTVFEIPLRALEARVQPHPVTPDNTFDMPLPFNDRPVSLRGGEGFVLFASNEPLHAKGDALDSFRGGRQPVAFDVAGGARIVAPAGLADQSPEAPAVVEWLKRAGQGRFGLSGRPSHAPGRPRGPARRARRVRLDRGRQTQRRGSAEADRRGTAKRASRWRPCGPSMDCGGSARRTRGLSWPSKPRRSDWRWRS